MLGEGFFLEHVNALFLYWVGNLILGGYLNFNLGVFETWDDHAHLDSMINSLSYLKLIIL